MNAYFRILGYLSSALKRRVYLIAPLLGVAGVLEVVSIASLIPLLSVALDANEAAYWMQYIGLNSLTHYQTLAALSFCTLLAFGIKSAFVLSVNRYTFYTALRIRAFFQKLLFRLYLNSEYGYHQQRNSAEYLRNMTSECYSLEGRFVMPGLTLVAEIIPIIFIAAFLLVINPFGLLVAVGVFGVAGFLVTKFTAARLKALGKVQLDSDGHLLKTAQQSFHCLKEVYVYNRQAYLVNQFSGFADKATESIARALTLNLVPRFLMEIIALLVIILIAVVSLNSGADINDLIVELGVFFGAVIKLLPSSSRVVNQLQSLNHARPTIENLLKEINNLSLVNDTSNQSRYGDLDFKFASLHLEGVSFEYPNGNEIFRDLTIDITAGDVIGIVGETGSGKTTLLNLLLGLLHPTAGRVLVNNYDRSQVFFGWRNSIAYVPQEIFIMDDSIAGNVAFIESDSEIDIGRVEEALKLASLYEMVSRMPQGIHTQVGERGAVLSGGQRQRIGLARALYRNPQVLVLDEATSALDNETEGEIVRTIAKLKGEITILLVSHRSQPLSICDRKFVVRKGVVTCS